MSAESVLSQVRKIKALDTEKVECVFVDERCVIKINKSFNKADLQGLAREYQKYVGDVDAVAINIDNYFKFVAEVCVKYSKHYRSNFALTPNDEVKTFAVDISEMLNSLQGFKIFKKVIELTFDGEFFEIESLYESKKPIRR